MLAVILGALIVGCVCATSIDPTVHGGWPASIGQFPHQVSLRQSSNSQHFAGASIISTQWLLTSASPIFRKKPSSIIAVVGTNYLNSGGWGYSLYQIIVHSGYNSQNNANDIAVLRVNGNIGLSNVIRIVNLATATIPGGLGVTLSGWGTTSYVVNQLPNDLHYVQVTSITVKECQRRLKGYQIYDTNQCTSAPYGQGACVGDTGGPLIYGSQQVGILSWGITCAKGDPDVYTSVAAYRSWIRSTTGV